MKLRKIRWVSNEEQWGCCWLLLCHSTSVSTSREDFLRFPTPGHRATWRHHRHAGNIWIDMDNLRKFKLHIDIWHISWHIGWPVVWTNVHPQTAKKTVRFTELYQVNLLSQPFQLVQMGALMSLMYSPAYSRPSGLNTTQVHLQEIYGTFAKSGQICSNLSIWKTCKRNLWKKIRKWSSLQDFHAEIPATTFLSCKSRTGFCAKWICPDHAFGCLPTAPGTARFLKFLSFRQLPSTFLNTSTSRSSRPNIQHDSTWFNMNKHNYARSVVLCHCIRHQRGCFWIPWSRPGLVATSISPGVGPSAVDVVAHKLRGTSRISKKWDILIPVDAM